MGKYECTKIAKQRLWPILRLAAKLQMKPTRDIIRRKRQSKQES
jgi:hypothetical protein